MALSINWATRVITVPTSDLTLVSGTLYEFDTDAFRLELKDIEDSEDGIVHDTTHSHNTEYTVAGVTYARAIQMINRYSVTFEDGSYSVRLVGSNNDIWDIQGGILNQNQVQVIPTNSAGLQVVTQGSGVTAQDKLDIADTLLDRTSGIETGMTFRQAMRLMAAVLFGKSSSTDTTYIFRDVNDTTDRITATVDGDGHRTDVTVDDA